MNTATQQFQQTQTAPEAVQQQDARQQWSPVIEAHDLIMDYTASMARAQAGHGVTGVMPAGTGAAVPAANGQPGFAMPTMHTLALNHVSFALGEGETVAVMGPSGSGKSTLLHALAGIIKPTAGTVTFRGSNLDAMSDAGRTKLRRNAFGFVFQSGQLEMSGGQMQRIAIARALAVKPAVVFADEPTGALDQTTGREVMSILMAAARDNGAAVVVVTHDPNVAGFCGRTVMMQDGRLHQPDADANAAAAVGHDINAGGKR